MNQDKTSAEELEELEILNSNSFWAGRLIDLPKDDAWKIADEIVESQNRLINLKTSELQKENEELKSRVKELEEAVKVGVKKGVKFGSSNPYYQTPEGLERIREIAESLLKPEED
jgi:hypothetical protein